ncbi:hypothetical protein BDV24DRAFT_133650 [Aspergillus arachidicola]|uniref:Uncharacterized protein n=1 Tax=Aspergillus arachidicola TaxID=656916 RepID=A0A5N6Y8C4_9EURO|nr:hypothetical protein BDV24DRAFT_133650 [Aspergillus arachidicola]
MNPAPTVSDDHSVVSFPRQIAKSSCLRGIFVICKSRPTTGNVLQASNARGTRRLRLGMRSTRRAPSMMTRSQQKLQTHNPGGRQNRRGASLHATFGQAPSHYRQPSLRTRRWNSETGFG